MNVNVEKELREAYAAREALREQTELQKQVDRIPHLEKQKRTLDNQKNAGTALEFATEEAKVKFLDLAERVPLVRARLEALVKDIQVLALDIQHIEAEIFLTGQPLLNAQSNYDTAYIVKAPTVDELNADIPNDVKLEATFNAALERAGADDPRLNLMPKNPLPDWMAVVLHSLGTYIAYNPRKLASNWRHH